MRSNFDDLLEVDDVIIVKLGLLAMILSVVFWPLNVIMQPLQWLSVRSVEPPAIGFWEHLFQKSWREPLVGVLSGVFTVIAGLVYKFAWLLPQKINEIRMRRLAARRNAEILSLAGEKTRPVGMFIGWLLSGVSGVVLFFAGGHGYIVILATAAVYALAIYLLFILANRELGAAAFVRTRNLFLPYVIFDVFACVMLMFVGALTCYVSIRILGAVDERLYSHLMDAETTEVFARMREWREYWPGTLQTLKAILYATAIAAACAWLLPLLLFRDWGSLTIILIVIAPIILNQISPRFADVRDENLRWIADWFSDVPLPVSMVGFSLLGSIIVDRIKALVPSAYTCGSCGESLRPEYHHCPVCGNSVDGNESPAPTE